jgi:hypothetical protein
MSQLSNWSVVRVKFRDQTFSWVNGPDERETDLHTESQCDLAISNRQA